MKNSALFVTEIKSYYKDKILKFLKPQVEEFSITTFIFKFKKNNFFRFFFIIIKIQTHIVHVNKHLQLVFTLNGPSHYTSSNVFDLKVINNHISFININITSPFLLSLQKIMLKNIIYV